MKTHRVCVRCKNEVTKVTCKELRQSMRNRLNDSGYYKFYCKHCDELLYSFETKNKKHS